MPSRPELPRQTNFEQAERLAQAALQELDPRRQAARTACRLVDGDRALELDFFGRAMRVTFPAGVVTSAPVPSDAGSDAGGGEVPIWERILLLHYVGALGGDPDAPPDDGLDQLIGFANVPEGLFYLDPFRRRSHLPLAGFFGGEPARLLAAGAAIGAPPVALGDAAVRGQVFPRVPVIVVVYGADEELPPEAKLLFTPSVTSYLCAEDIAIVGGMTAGRLLKAGRR